MKKSLVYIVSGITSIVALFLAYAQLGFKFPAEMPDKIIKEIKAGADSKNMAVTFFEYMDMSSNIQPQTFASRLANLLVLAAIICVVTLFVVGIMKLLNKKAVVIKEMNTKIISLVACSCFVVALLLGLIFPTELPPTEIPGVTLKSGIGIGAIIFLVATLANVAGSYLFKEE